MKTIRLLLLTLVVCALSQVAHAQETVDHRNAARTAPFRMPAYIPGSCTTGDFYFDLLNHLWACGPDNTWSQGFAFQGASNMANGPVVLDAGGNATIGSTVLPNVINPKNCDGVHDNVCWQAAINAAVTGSIIQGVKGTTYVMTAPLTMTSLTNVSLDGHGSKFLVSAANRLMDVTACAGIKIYGMNVVGTVPTAVGVAGQGEISLVTNDQTEIYGNRWTSVHTAIFIGDGNTRLGIHNNYFMDTAAGVQGGGTGVSIVDNTFRGYVTTADTYGSDDQIALLAVNSSDVSNWVIARNIIDKQGATATNQAHCILVKASDTNSIRNVSVVQNVCTNQATSTVAGQQAAFRAWNAGSGTVTQIAFAGNTAQNVCAGVVVDGAVSSIAITNNLVNTTGCNISNSPFGQGIRLAGTHSDVNISGNTINSAAGIGMYAGSITGGSIIGNIVDGFTTEGFDITSSTGLKLTGNTAQNGTGTGIFLNALTGSTVSSSSANGNSTYGMSLAGTMTDVKFIGYTSTSNTSGALLDSSAHSGVTFLGFEGSTSAIEGGLALTGPLTGSEIAFSGTAAWLRSFGDGSDGGIACNGNIAKNGEIWVSSFVVANGNTCTLNVANVGLVIRSTGACQIAGTLNARGVDAGSSVAGDFGGSGGGGGGGAGSGAAGTASGVNLVSGSLAWASGGTGGTAGAAGGNGSAVPTNRYYTFLSSGAIAPRGGAPGQTGGSSGGPGGKGGQAVVIVCPSMDLTGTINASGANGTDSPGNNQGPGGGGGGGYVVVAAQTYVNNSGTITTAAGTGGSCGAFTGCGVGGNGGAGWSKVLVIQ